MIFYLIEALLFLQICVGQDIIPQHNISEQDASTMEGPVLLQWIPKVECQENMTAFSSLDDDSEMVCDCVAGYIYYPPKDSCYLPYRQGPCCCHEYLIYDPMTRVASCQWNPCAIDGYVPLNGFCYKLETFGYPCQENDILTIDEDNFEIKCGAPKRAVFQLFVAPLKKCPAGSRRNARGSCRSVI